MVGEQQRLFKTKKIIMKKETCTCTDECLGYLTKECKKIEESEQETLEEAAKRYTSHSLKEERQKDLEMGFIEGAKWQQERSYSDEEVLNKLTHFAVEIQRQNKQGIVPLRIKEWFDLNKKK